MDHSEFLKQQQSIERAFRKSDNLIIQGDNKSILRGLQDVAKGSVTCAYIDPPYNNLENWTHYSDSERSGDWLSGLKDTAALIRDLLEPEGSLWVSIDDRELHYLKVALDDVFQRSNFVHTIVWQQRTTRENRKVFSNNHEYILVYARDAAAFKRKRNLLPADESLLGRYTNPDNDPRGPWQSVSLNAQAGHATAAQFYKLRAPSGKVHEPPKGRCWSFVEKRMKAEIAAGNIWFGRDGNGVPRLKKFLRESSIGLTPQTLWLASEVGTNDIAKKHVLSLLPDEEVFDTPKPEALVKRIFEIASNPGDLVLDAYLGSGTSAAVAQKMGRRYVGIEIGDHVLSHCVTRLNKVIEGEQGGVSGDTSWKGGGSYKLVKAS